MEPPSLEETVHLVRAAQQGDRSALDALFARYLPRVRRIVGIRLGRTAATFADLDDLVQESLLDAFRSLHSVKQGSEGSFCNWLCRCVENTVRDFLRRAGAQKRGGGRVRTFTDCSVSTLADSVFPGDATTPSQAARGHELDAEIERALLGLDPHYREAIILRTVCGLSAVEMAGELGLRTAADAQKLFERARNKLARALGR